MGPDISKGVFRTPTDPTVVDPTNSSFRVKVLGNGTSDGTVQVEINALRKQRLQLGLWSLDGRPLESRSMNVDAGTDTYEFNVGAYERKYYILIIQNEFSRQTLKINSY